jgi:hypothetical protein
MGKSFFRLFSESLLAFETRMEHQSNQRRCVKLHLAPIGDFCIYDSVLPQPDGPALYRGIGIDAYTVGEAGNRTEVQPFCERLLGLLSYSHMSPCHPARLEMTYDADPGQQERAFTFIRTRTVSELASLRKIDLDLFRSVSEGQHFDDTPKWLALEWFRKGLTEQHTLDEFVAYWSALEIIAGILKQLYSSSSEKSYPHCPICKRRMAACSHCGGDVGTASPWSGVFHLIDQGIGLDRKAFGLVRKFRGGMLHGGTDLSKQAVERMKARELVVLRRLVVFALAASFQLPKEVTERIANQTVHRVVSPLNTRLFGTLVLDCGEPPSIENVGAQPFLGIIGNSESFKLNEHSKLSASTKVEYKAVGATFKVNKAELWTDQSAGITGGSISLDRTSVDQTSDR